MTPSHIQENESRGGCVTAQSQQISWMTSLLDRFQQAQPYEAWLAASTQPKLVALQRSIRSRTEVAPALVERVTAVGRRWHFLLLSADWCSDAVSIEPWIDALCAETPLLSMRLLDRDQHLDLMDQHLTNGRSRSIPVVLVLDEQGVERAWWGPRPRALQAWVMSDAAQAMAPEVRFRETRRWYTEDRGRAILTELVALLERCAESPDGGLIAPDPITPSTGELPGHAE